MEAIKENSMAPFYEKVCADLTWTIDQNLLKAMRDANTAKLKTLDESIQDAVDNLGETEVRDFMIEKANYLCAIGDKEAALKAYTQAYEKTVALGVRLDILFTQTRIGLFYMDNDLTSRNLQRAKTLIEEGGDWDRRNRLKVYEGLYEMSIRNFSTAANRFLETVATFTSYELMDYKTFVTYTVLASMIALDRPTLRKKVIRGAEIIEVLHGLPHVKEYLTSLYECRYADFFKGLAKVEQMLKYDRYLHSHFGFYTREMRILSYTQHLNSYRSLTLGNMADAFGVTPAWVDQELARFIAAGRLHCKIDKVNGIVETNRPDSKNWQYQETIKKGDILLNRVQKLSRVINI